LFLNAECTKPVSFPVGKTGFILMWIDFTDFCYFTYSIWNIYIIVINNLRGNMEYTPRDGDVAGNY